MRKKYLNKTVQIQWFDSYFSSGWQEIENYKSNILLVKSIGKVINENKKTITITGNYAEETINTPFQANGMMTIPKCCIKKIKIIFYKSAIQ